ncbi:MAG: NAD(P)-dependent oxidoreductase [Candidatus Melainabacteria bacterium]|uniref:NAD-dependent epimerase/dehydratase family protein n=1 Tax=unclassified Rhizobium TaxID=2613769 RepID=UPI000646BB73|nr:MULTISPECIES: NAD-dependent epimerase/dehydratase family protein [unclassified Rhizobium]MBN9397492.1 NAD(P)-dependent oxidoreductase [Candidatus Melainabacteria bacterium]OJY78462.1 MAG: hypothetical protein BGP09_03260 [Rhizobium sp. 60-20]RKD35499.1 nucleoside-diphosphate-sugar epimerase [Rhizobium sp. WW_1]
MTNALIGHTGFVGGNLLAQTHFDFVYNSSNISEIDGRSFQTVVCAGVRAVKWWANKNPQEDWQGIANLIHHLSRVQTDKFVLISTVDVYNVAENVTEDDLPCEQFLHAYGLNRLKLESFVQTHFSNHQIIRLPALFGPGLKKNVIYDLMNNNMIEAINPASAFQWYPVRRLTDDLARASASDAKLINFATPPVSVAKIHERFFSALKMGAHPNPPAVYDIHTKHAALFSSNGDYIMQEAEIFDELAHFLQGNRL